MNHLKSYNESISDEKILLGEDVKKYFWSKIEYTKKKRAISNKNKLFNILTSPGDSEISSDDMIDFLNSLEYSIKKQMKSSDKIFRNKNAMELKGLIPDDWIGVKYSSLLAKYKRDKKNK